MRIELIGVVGAGQMGSGIAQVALAAGFPVVLVDAVPGVAEKAAQRIQQRLDNEVAKGRLPTAAREQARRLQPSESLGSLAQADVVIEAVPEDLDLKMQVLAKVDRTCKPEALLASNTSTLSITRLQSATGRPEQVAGMHFFIPAPVMKLVEITPGLLTAPETATVLTDLARTFKKEPVQSRDYPGFIVNRLLVPMWNSAANMVMQGFAPQAIDTAMKLGANLPMGPLELADMAGLDTALAVVRILYEGFSDPAYRPSPLLIKMVESGRLGRKTGQGFYKYST